MIKPSILKAGFNIQLRNGKINCFQLLKTGNNYEFLRGRSEINGKEFFEWYDYYIKNKKFAVLNDTVKKITKEQRQKIIEIEVAKSL